MQLDSWKVQLLCKKKSLKVWINWLKVIANKSIIGKSAGTDAPIIIEALHNLSQSEINNLSKAFNSETTNQITIEYKGLKIPIQKEYFDIIEKIRKVHEERFIPNVIEPSFGIGRLLYWALEHAFEIRADDERRWYFNFPAKITPYE